jgi:hypothetical protein
MMADQITRSSLSLGATGAVQGQIDVPPIFTGTAFAIPMNKQVQGGDHWATAADALDALADYLKQTAKTLRSDED